MLSEYPAQSSVLEQLRKETALFAALGFSLLAACYAALRLGWEAKYAALWLILPSVAVVYQLTILLYNLPANVRLGETQPLPNLGWGNRLTLVRGFLAAGVMGFLLLPRPEGWLAWLPGILYTLSCAADFFDGYAARMTNHATRLGEVLDMSFDGIGVLAASLLAVQYGQAPAWYVLVGLARYLFLGGLWLRKRLDKPIYELPPSLSRRIFAGLQMGFLAILLWPLFSPPGTHIAAALFGLPLLFGFGRDWLYVSGVLKQRQPRKRPGEALRNWALTALRGLILALNLSLLIAWSGKLSNVSLPLIALGVLNGLAVALIVFGVLPRVAAGFALGFLGFYQMLSPLTASQIVLAVAYTIILYAGSGALSLWTPEDYLYRHRAGERYVQRG
ncbi:MAG: CDP-alcohol phosphatidyltransferase family protein [Anaerolineales bacterium]|nr:CDP-alcohol phosphatidyltransferase family protein [Anaerolineales bacterium]